MSFLLSREVQRILTWGGRIVFFLSPLDELDECHSVCELGFKCFFFEPVGLCVCFVLINRLVLAGPGEQLILISSSKKLPFLVGGALRLEVDLEF